MYNTYMKSSHEEKRKGWLTFNKHGIGGIEITAPNKKEALKIARDQWGRGAKVEYRGIISVTVIPNT